MELNKEQANDFFRKYAQDTIKVIRIESTQDDNILRAVVELTKERKKNFLFFDTTIIDFSKVTYWYYNIQTKNVEKIIFYAQNKNFIMRVFDRKMIDIAFSIIKNKIENWLKVSPV